MPYPFAHPAAIVPLAGPMGRFAVPSALAIGSMIPDAWYFVPLLVRNDSHSLGGLLWFCLPAGLLVYLLFHIVLKQPLLALLPVSLAAKLAQFASPRLPEAAWHAVVLSLLVGACTHLAWDAISHTSRVLQHASTLLGTLFMAGWIRRRVQRAGGRELPPPFALSPLARHGALALLAALSAGWAAWAAWVLTSQTPGFPDDAAGLRQLLRGTGIAGAQALAAGVLAYAVLMTALTRNGPRDTGPAPRSPGGR
jgi:hypothetical protein